MRLKESNSVRRILDFDIENRPLAYWYNDATTGEITAIAWSWLDVEDIQVRALGEVTAEEMLSEFVEAYNQADIVTGHYIRRHDLPIVNAGLIELGMRPLKGKKSHDTKLDLVRTAQLSMSQEALGAILGIEAPKVQMNQKKWREANRLTPEGIEYTKERVVGDVKQHIEMRYALIERGMLRPPSMWYPVPGGFILENE